MFKNFLNLTKILIEWFFFIEWQELLLLLLNIFSLFFFKKVLIFALFLGQTILIKILWHVYYQRYYGLTVVKVTINCKTFYVNNLVVSLQKS